MGQLGNADEAIDDGSAGLDWHVVLLSLRARTQIHCELLQLIVEAFVVGDFLSEHVRVVFLSITALYRESVLNIVRINLKATGWLLVACSSLGSLRFLILDSVESLDELALSFWLHNSFSRS